MSIESTDSFVGYRERFSQLREALANAQPPITPGREPSNEVLSERQEKALCEISAARAILRASVRGHI